MAGGMSAAGSETMVMQVKVSLLCEHLMDFHERRVSAEG